MTARTRTWILLAMLGAVSISSTAAAVSWAQAPAAPVVSTLDGGEMELTLEAQRQQILPELDLGDPDLGPVLRTTEYAYTFTDVAMMTATSDLVIEGRVVESSTGRTEDSTIFRNFVVEVETLLAGTPDSLRIAWSNPVSTIRQCDRSNLLTRGHSAKVIQLHSSCGQSWARGIPRPICRSTSSWVTRPCIPSRTVSFHTRSTATSAPRWRRWVSRACGLRSVGPTTRFKTIGFHRRLVPKTCFKVRPQPESRR